MTTIEQITIAAVPERTAKRLGARGYLTAYKLGGMIPVGWTLYDSFSELYDSCAHVDDKVARASHKTIKAARHWLRKQLPHATIEGMRGVWMP